MVQYSCMSRTLNEREWPDYLCDDIRPILMLLLQEHGARMHSVVHDLKAVSTNVYLEEKIPAQAMGLLAAQCLSNPNLRLGDGWVACLQDYCYIGPKEESRVVQGKSLWVWLKKLVKKDFR